MNKFFYYNSLCTGANTPGVFSIDPYVAAIKELLVSELKQVVYYIEKLRALDFDMESYTDKVIEFIAVLIINLDFTKENTFIIIEDLYNNKKMLEKMYISACEKTGAEAELFPEETENLSSKNIILKALNDKEKDIKTGIRKTNFGRNRKYLYEIMMNIVLNVCSSLIELKSYGRSPKAAQNEVLKFLNTANIPSLTDDDIKTSIKNFAFCSYETANTLSAALKEQFGPLIETEVKFCTKKGKAILVSGNCYSELALILNAVKGLNINVYSYGSMISAFQYEKFKEHPNFAGAYNNDSGSVQSDFAMFPGPVFVSKNSMPKIDVIRGRIFTSAKYPAFGISKIENNNFEPLIQCALDSDGFKEDKVFKSVKIGSDIDNIMRKITEIAAKFADGEIKNIIITGLTDRFSGAERYTKEFINIKDKESFIISFAFNSERDNFMYVNSYLDFGMLYEIIENLKKAAPDINKYISVIIADCNREAVTHIFNLIHAGVKNIFLGPCCPNIVNPLLTDGLERIFNIKQLTEPEKDFSIITNS